MVRPFDILVAEDLLQSPYDKHFLGFGTDCGTAARATGNNASAATVANVGGAVGCYRWHNFAPKQPPGYSISLWVSSGTAIALICATLYH